MMRSRIYDLGYALGLLMLVGGLAFVTIAPVFI